MHDATLIILNGPARGVRFEVRPEDSPMIIGRSVGTNIRLDDSEVSRRHAEIRAEDGRFEIRDLSSANGTFVNGKKQSRIGLRNGDSLRLGNTRVAFQVTVAAPAESDSVNAIQLVDDAPGYQSSIIQQLQADNASSATIWPQQRQGHELLYQVAEELVRPVQEFESALRRILGLTMDAVGADRACILLKESASGDNTIGSSGSARPDDLIPAAFFRRGKAQQTEEIMPVSRSIASYVLKRGRAVRTSNASADSRFDGGSIVSSGIREAICAPMRGQEELIGVVYVDNTSKHDGLPGGSRLTDEHLKAVLAVARQTALAVESRRFHNAFLKAERFAAMGQTVAVLSHHIKNILQGVKGGGFLLNMGLDQSDEQMVRQGWGIIEKNQGRIHDLVMDMLSFSKERVPNLTTGSINEVCQDVIELAQTAAEENDVSLEFRPTEHLPAAEFDKEGIHRAVLNIVANAIDAVAESEDGAVVVQTGFDDRAGVMLVAVSDNGPGIPEDQRQVIFNVFESSKGSRGTGIGLPVSRKIIREHGGRVRIEGGPGEGTRFVLSWPRGNPDQADDGSSFGARTLMLDPPE
ncbi:MAG TPA: histidine kinase [Planctomycetaceae bacterium]|nr:histidine kinase [Planctomycetaceae bacterium]